MSRDDYLFSKMDVHGFKQALAMKIAEEADGLSDADLKAGTVDEAVDKLVKRWFLAVPTLNMADVETEQGEVDMEMPNDARFFLAREHSARVRGTEVTFYVPYIGSGDLFHVRPSTWGMSPPIAEVEDGELVIRLRDYRADAATLKKSFEETIASINTYLSRLREDLKDLDQLLRGTARPRIEQRRAKRTQDSAIVETLGFKQRSRQ